LIKYKDIAVGKVINVHFTKDLKQVIVEAEIKKEMIPYLSENTRFWVMKAKLGINEVQGLETLLSGVYIVMDPKKGTRELRKFSGLENIPIIPSSEKGKSFILEANNLGSLEVGSPIYYTKLKAGNIESYKLDERGKSVHIKVFIKEPFADFVTTSTRFWNVSGFRANINADGIELQTGSLVSVLIGGIAFDNFNTSGVSIKAKELAKFSLHESYKKAKEKKYTKEIYFWVHFSGSIRGLDVGSSVEFKGVKIGEVVYFSLNKNEEDAKFDIPILIQIEPERFGFVGKDNKREGVNFKLFKKMVDNGLRAQLKSASLLTGKLFIDIDFHKDAPKLDAISIENGLYVMPSVPATIDSIEKDFKGLLKKLSKIDYEKIGKDVETTLELINKKTLPNLNTGIKNVDELMTESKKRVNELNQTIELTNRVLNSANQNYLDENAEINKKLIRLLDELSKASRSIKNLSDYLNRHPESLIKGKQ